MPKFEFLDFSQFNTWEKCELAWWERYGRGYRKDYKGLGQRDDAMCVGSLVHDGLEGYYKRSLPQITEASIVEYDPTPEALSLARLLVAEYVKQFPKEAEGWKLIATEKPLMCPAKPVPLLAKLDAYFLVEQDTVLSGGPHGESVVLEPGYWVQEYKTKSDGRRDLFSMRWEVDKQVDFQMLCLQASLPPNSPPVRGVLINAIEKPRSSPPTRKCKGCGASYLYSAYVGREGGLFACPTCEHEQKLTPLKGDNALQQPTFFRLPVRRSQEQLEVSFKLFEEVAEKMQWAFKENYGHLVPRFASCVHPIFGACEFFSNHTYGLDVQDDFTFVKVDAIGYTREAKET